MALNKQPIAINFTKGLDLKTDPFQVQVGNFLALNNSVFTTTGRLTKRHGFSNITNLPNNYQSTLTTLNDNLIATGSNLYAFSEDTNQWLNQGIIQPVQLNTLPLVRISTSQTSPDTGIAPNGLVLLTYMEGGNSYYQVSDSVTGQQIVKKTGLIATAVAPRAFVLGNYFIIMFIDMVGGNAAIQYIATPWGNPSNTMPVATFSSNVGSTSSGYDGQIINGNLYVAWEGSSSVNIAYLNTILALSPTTVIASGSASLVSVTGDATRSRVFVSYYNGNTFAAAFTYLLVLAMSPTPIGTGVNYSELTSVATNGTCTVFSETVNDYGYDATIRTDYVSGITVTLPGVGTGPGTTSSLTFPTAATPTPVVGMTPTIILRSVGLASKAFIGVNGTIYMLVAYGDTNQSNPANNSNEPTYFLIDETGSIYMRLAYSNGGGYARNQVLPNVTFRNDQYYVPYLLNDFLASVNKGTNLPIGTPTNAIYTQTGVGLAKFTLNTTQQYSSEIAGTLNLTGGLLWEYDGVKPVENNFQVWPENIEAGTTTGSGGLTAQTYYYVFTYEWTNSQGNLERSAPSIPLAVTTTTGSSTNTLHVPTLRLTYKISPNPVRIVGYRWSQAQQIYYQFTSLTSPILNDPTVDYVNIVDANSDAAILGNVLLYTTGGVIENIGAPASIASALFDNRLWIVDAEDQNLLWYSKQVIENVPVEMSDLLTFYVAPTTSAQGSTGTITALYPMDDKLIIFKRNAAYYVNGTGPDNTGSNSTYSQPIFITASVGCANPNSIVLMPQGLMFQSDKGIWLLGRDLSTKYIGAQVEAYNATPVLSATAVPGTTQIRFILDTGTTLMYDYFFDQWATHSNVLAISGTLYQGFHTYLNSLGQIFQESATSYLDGSTPVLMSLTTSWINVAGLQGFERFYFANLLGTYVTPFKLNVGMAYNYNPSNSQAILVTPDNYTPPWGGEAVWGSGSSWGSEQPLGTGSPGNVFSARLWPEIQKCQSFQVSIQEIYDSTLGVSAGEGLTLSGLALIVGLKKGYRTQSAIKSFG